MKAQALGIFLLFLLSTVLSAQPVNVMTFNIRYPNPDDGVNYWPNRKEKVASIIRFHQADIIGVQEAFRAQLDEISTMLPEYEWVGHCRTDGSLQPDPDNEFSAILYRYARFEKLNGGTFWLSPTPNEAGSKGWDAALPRVATWVKLRDKRNEGVFFVFNTHFDHRGDTARLESAKLILRKIRSIAGEAPVMLTGDFNCGPGSLPYNAITAANSPVEDAMHRSEMPHHGPNATWTDSFKVPGTGERIDYIFVTRGVIVHRHAALSESWGGRLPSDHLPVFAELELPKD
ncbi:endonuclease/exonuclease/phosphatase family protein [Phaeodactylibacter xiamenensis]|uniref:endonuclease/exonuclease/phosphatase family protein n=1 Tax=Phaeodactylibacter xiamenensis TaxID=1524460 RepID=UPI003BA8FCAD